MKKKLLVLVLSLFLLFVFPTSVQARQGCCSWHGGVDHCDTSVGRYVCNDGTYSPSCGCYIDPVPATSKPTLPPTPTPIPTVVPTIRPTPTQTPITQVEGASTSSGGSVLGGLIGVTAVLGGGYYGLKWLARVTAPKDPENTV